MRLAALENASAKLGHREAAGRPNQGPIVELVARPFLSAIRFLRAYDAGQLRWCAFFASWIFLEALKQRGDLARIDAWMRIASGDVDTLWLQLAAQISPEGSSWCWIADVDGVVPEPGDLVFFGAPEDLTHVAIVERAAGLDVVTIGGNEGDRVAAHRYRLGSERGRRIVGFARVPW